MSKRNLQGLLDEFESTDLEVAALRDALGRATRFDRVLIERSLIEALRSYRRAGFELMDALEAEIDDAVSAFVDDSLIESGRLAA